MHNLKIISLKVKGYNRYMNNLTNLKYPVANIIFSLKLLYRASKFYFIYNFIMNICFQFVMILQHVYLVSYIVYCIENHIPFYEVVNVMLSILTFVVIRLLVYSWFQSYKNEQLIQKINLQIKNNLYLKASKLDIENYDDPVFYNDIMWAMKRAPEEILETFKSFNDFSGLVFKTIVVGGFVLSKDLIGGIVVITTLITTLKLKKIGVKKEYEFEIDKIILDRKHDYILRVFYLNEYAKELKISKIGLKFINDYRNTTEEKIALLEKYKKVFLLINTTVDFLRNTLLFDGIYLTFLFYLVYVKKQFSLAVLLALYNSSRNLKDSIDQSVTVLSKFSKHSLFIGKLKVFLNKKSRNEDFKINFENNQKYKGIIGIENLNFSYKSCEDNVINNLSFKIAEGEKVAIVGKNGSGKTTLIKLLLRLYNVQSGNIYIDGIHSSNISEYSYKQLFSVLFQNFQIYSFSVKDNILMSKKPLNEVKINKLLKAMDFDAKRIYEDLDKYISNEFDKNGISLSGGQMQKLAFIRVLYSDSKIIILDEPSSSLDSESELKFNQFIANISEGKTIIIISHRLTTTKFVDKIIYLENGHAEEVGTHSQLIAMNGQYAKLYKEQASQYL